MKNLSSKIEQLQSLLNEDKFLVNGLYSGVEDDKMKTILIDNVNTSVQQFIKVVEANGTKDDYLITIANGLDRALTFKYELDTEDAEAFCTYYERMMDAVDLESSEGLLNKWLYGFDI